MTNTYELNNLKKDSVLTLMVDWEYKKDGLIIPLDGAEISIIDNIDPSVKPIIGELQDGLYTFVVPRDNFDFKVTISAKYKSKLIVKSWKDEIISAEFHNKQRFVIKDLEPEIGAWSVFQAMVDLINITNNELRFFGKMRTVYIEPGDQGSFYRPENIYTRTNNTEPKLKAPQIPGCIYIGTHNRYAWDVIAHEFGHAISDESNSTGQTVGGIHDGSNQYDLFHTNNLAFKNKQASLSLALNEGFGTWFGVALLTYSKYKNSIPHVGDALYTDELLGIEFDLESNVSEYYGEDTERAVMRILWDLFDGKEDDYKRIKTRNIETDRVAYRLSNLWNNIFFNNRIDNISTFYQKMIKYHAGIDNDYFAYKNMGDSIDPNILEKIHELGVIFAEFGIAPNINDAIEAVSKDVNGKDIQQYIKGEINWSQLKTGTLPSHDQFDIYFFDYEKKKLLYKIENKSIGTSGNSIKQTINKDKSVSYQYILQKNDNEALEDALSSDYRMPITILIRAIATKESAENASKTGAIETGPYFSHLAYYGQSAKKTVIAVDSSGSNSWNDPSDLRIGAAHKLLEKMVKVNESIKSGSAKEYDQTIETRAMDFDSQVKWLSVMEDPERLLQRQIFNRVDSSGGTDIARAVYAGIDELKTTNPSSDDRFKNTLYLLTDMENGSGWSPIMSAIASAKDQGIKVQLGHLNPPALRSFSPDMKGDVPFVESRARVPFDDIIELLLETGGSYATIENAESQEAWVDLVDYLDRFNAQDIAIIPLPLDIVFYRLAYNGIKTPTYKITPQKSGVVTVTVDSKGSFTPELKVAGNGTQKALGNDLYEVTFRVVAGKTYDVEINKSFDTSGLYSIVARIEETKTMPKICDGSLITTGAALLEGGVYVWGFRGSAQQGNGVRVVKNNAAPQKVENLSNIVQLATGAYHLLALDESGDVWGWGQNIYGEAGGQATYVPTPEKVMSNVCQLATGEYFSLALDNTGAVWGWGQNLYGQLGNGTNKNSKVPVLINLQGEKVRLIGGAYEGCFAVTEEGHVWAWGDNEASGLGFKGTSYGVQKIIRTPTRVPNLDHYAGQIVYIAGGNGWGEALLDDGKVIGWGLHASLGIGTSKTNLSSPDPVVIMENVQQLFARYIGSFALTNDGKLFTWGQTAGSAFKMIYGESVTQQIPVKSNITRIGGGKEHLFYETEDGKIYGIGYNDIYKLDQNKAGAPHINWPGSEIIIK